jgi:hypothetical protein
MRPYARSEQVLTLKVLVCYSTAGKTSLSEMDFISEKHTTLLVEKSSLLRQKGATSFSGQIDRGKHGILKTSQGRGYQWIPKKLILL